MFRLINRTCFLVNESIADVTTMYRITNMPRIEEYKGLCELSLSIHNNYCIFNIIKNCIQIIVN